MRVLYIAEIVGKPGVFCVKSEMSTLRETFAPDLIIANGDGATNGFGIGKNHAINLRKLGVDIITSGDQVYYKKDMVTHLANVGYIVRPANHLYENPGRGWQHICVAGQDIVIVSLLGQIGFNGPHVGNPFAQLPKLIDRIHRNAQTVILDFHALTTSEKNAMHYFADGMVSAMIGSGQRVQTADERILPKGSAVICDAGRTGSQVGVGGLDPDIELRKFLSQIPERSADCWLELQLQGVCIDIDAQGRALSIERLRRPIPTPEHLLKTANIPST